MAGPSRTGDAQGDQAWRRDAVGRTKMQPLQPGERWDHDLSECSASSLLAKHTLRNKRSYTYQNIVVTLLGCFEIVAKDFL